MITAILISAALAAFFGLVLSIAAKRYQVREDPRIEAIYEALPHADCGACGYAGCMEFAKHAADDPLASCRIGGAKVSHEIGRILGRKMEVMHMHARVNCSGGRNAKDSFIYDGPKSCRDANLLGSSKECPSGCLGYGDCVAACRFEAISIGKEGFPVVSKSRCTGCGACASACPKGLITLQKASDMYIIACSSHGAAKEKSKYCTAGCIACGTCARVCPVEAITMIDNLPKINYDLCINCGICAEKCPRKIIRRI